MQINRCSSCQYNTSMMEVRCGMSANAKLIGVGQGSGFKAFDLKLFTLDAL